MSELALAPQFVVDESGQRQSVLLSVADYEQLLDHLEDLEDVVSLDTAVSSAEGFRSYAEVRAQLVEAGRL